MTGIKTIMCFTQQKNGRYSCYVRLIVSLCIYCASQDGEFSPADIKDRVIDQLMHTCTTRRRISVCVIDERGE